MASAVLSRPTLGPIEPHILYPLTDLQARSGMGATALRTARRQGLKVMYTAGRGYVLGRDFIAYIEANSTAVKTPSMAAAEDSD